MIYDLDLDDEVLKTETKTLIAQEPHDLVEDLVDEILYIKTFMTASLTPLKNSIEALLDYILETNLTAIFWNFFTAIKLFCTKPVMVSKPKWSFSALGKSLKTRQRKTAGQNCLNHIEILIIENEMAKN